MPAFVPKFDVKETKSAYELEGELPGVHQKDIEIEFVDNITLCIKGHTMRPLSQPAYTNFRKATVKDAHTDSKSADRGTANTDEKPAIADASRPECSTTAAAAAVAKDSILSISEPKYLISERTLGNFERRFTFPVGVNQDGVCATMKNGILTITVPKAETSQIRKIHIT